MEDIKTEESTVLNESEAQSVKTEPVGFNPEVEVRNSLLPIELESQEAKISEQPALKRPKIESESEPVVTKSSEPVYEMVGGSSLRQYLNKHLTEHLLEGLRIVSQEKPANPLKRLGEYLIEVSESQQ